MWLQHWSADQTSKKALTACLFEAINFFWATVGDVLKSLMGGRVPFFHSMGRGRFLGVDVALPSRHTNRYFIHQGPLTRVPNLSSLLWEVARGPGPESREQVSLDPRTKLLQHEDAPSPMTGVGECLCWFLSPWTSLVNDNWVHRVILSGYKIV